jgi:ABC-type transport system involved in cytochrome c biogenesis permease subunit
MHELSYKTILFAFPFQSLLLITGAIWAYYAWGRSWGWDPKETWAFITWIVFLIYLHGKLLMNWKSNTLSMLSIFGFIVMVFAFLGVNLVLSGLHSYGSM